MGDRNPGCGRGMGISGPSLQALSDGIGALSLWRAKVQPFIRFKVQGGDCMIDLFKGKPFKLAPVHFD